jgi:small subunit ribosomal protein S18
MTSKKNKARAPRELNKKFKKKTSVLVTDKVEYIDYKDVNLSTAS